MNLRQGILFALLAATLGAVWWTGRMEEEGGAADADLAAPRGAHKAPLAAAPGGATPRAANNAAADNAVAMAPPAGNAQDAQDAQDDARFPGGGPDLFAGLSWRPPPPPAPPVVMAPPPPPMAPPLPFKYVGRWSDEKGETVFLALGNRMLDARAGQQLEQWRLDKIGADSLAFTYLPLDQQRQLRLTP